MPRIALVTAVAAYALDDDLPPFDIAAMHGKYAADWALGASLHNYSKASPK